ncbi:MAG: deoxyribose-phosphate aldolase [Paludibacteraceae bacterium]|nr:deoxyribose-phosphate aldolase [Paludibacteraceae bacterium]
MKDFKALFSAYQFAESTEDVTATVKKIIEAGYDRHNNIEHYKKLFNSLEITSLSPYDNEDSIRRLVEKINDLDDKFPELPSPAGICVYPFWVDTVKNLLTEDIAISTVVGFPSSQSYIEVKIAETALAVSSGATEIDMVLPVGRFLAQDYEEIHSEISEIKAAAGEAKLKVILESGLHPTPQSLYNASILALEAGADFIKTTTGKEKPTDLNAVYVMARALKDFNDKTKEEHGIKLAGGIKTTQDATMYSTIIAAINGDDHINSTNLRIGATGLANSLITSILKEDTVYF